MKIKVSFDPVAYFSKPEKDEIIKISERIGNNPVEMELLDLATEVGTKRYSFAPAIFDGTRSKEHFVQMQAFGLDFDHGPSYEEIKAIAEDHSLPIAFSYHTLRSKEDDPRIRVIFVHEFSIDNGGVAGVMMKMLHEIFPTSDSMCIDISRLFFGGKSLIGPVNEVTFSLSKLTEAFHKVAFMKEPKHYARKMESFAKANNIKCVNSILQIHDVNELGNVYKNGDESKNDPNTYGSKIFLPPDSPRYVVVFGYTAKERESFPDYEKSAIPKNALEEKCQLWRDFVHLPHIHHYERFLLLTNLIHMVGGEKMFLKVISKKHYDLKKWQFYKNYFVKKGYHPQSCDVCSYFDTCNHKKNLLLTVKEKDKIVKLKDTNTEYYPIDEIYGYIEDCLKETVNANYNGVTIIPAQTAIGKTEAYCNLIAEDKSRSYIIAVPTNRLKEEISTRIKSKGVDAFTTISLDELELPPVFKKKIMCYYELGLGRQVTKLLKDFIRQNEEADEPLSMLSLEQIKAYVHQMKCFSEKRVIITTHAKLITLSKEYINNRTVIVDEDILSTLFKNVRSVSIDAVMRVQKSEICPSILKDRLNDILSMKNGKYHCFGDAFDVECLSDMEMEQLGIMENINDIMLASVCYRNNEMIHYYCPKMLPAGKYIVLSATIDIDLYQRYFKGWMIKAYPYKKARYKGQIKQYTAYSMSRQCIQDNKEKIIPYLEQYKEDYTMITFLKYELELGGGRLHFGNAEGIDVLTGKNLLVFGTPHLCESIYKMIGVDLGMAVEQETLSVRKIRNNGYEFCIMTYKDEDLRRLQFYFINKELEQCIGRARLLRNDCSVLVYSNFPVEQAELIQEDYLEGEIEK